MSKKVSEVNSVIIAKLATHLLGSVGKLSLTRFRVSF